MADLLGERRTIVAGFLDPIAIGQRAFIGRSLFHIVGMEIARPSLLIAKCVYEIVGRRARVVVREIAILPQLECGVVEIHSAVVVDQLSEEALIAAERQPARRAKPHVG